MQSSKSSDPAVGEVSTLLVEDNPGDALLIQERIDGERKRPVTLSVCSTLAGALEAVATAEFDVILLDLGLPDSTGFETFERMHRAAPDTPIIILTGHDDRRIATRCIERGAHDYLIKGRVEGFIADAVYNTVARARTHQALIESYKNINRMVADSYDATLVLDEAHLVQFANPAAGELFGDRVIEGRHFELPDIEDGLAELDVKRPNGSRATVEMRISNSIWYGAPSLVVTFRDVTSRNEAEAARLAESERAQQYLDIAEVIFVAIDRQGIVSMINQKGCEVLGYAEDEIVGKSWFDNFVTQEVREQILPVAADLLAGRLEVAAYHENSILTKSGEERIIAWNNTVVKDAQGTIVAHLSSGEDITERRRAAERNRLLSEIVEQTPDGILCTDRNFKITYMNRSAEELFGWRLEELRGKSPDFLNVDPRSKQIQQEVYRSVKEKQVYQADALNRRRDGSTFVCQFRVAPILDEQGEIIAYMGAERDITDQKNLEAARQKALRETKANEERFRGVFQGVLEGILLADENQTIVMANQAMFQMLGYGQGELIGMSLGAIYPEENQPQFTEHAENQHGRPRLATDIPIKRKNGELLYVDVNATSITIDERRLSMGCFRDVTEKRNLRASVAQADRLASMGILAAGVAHEINNPLTYVLYNLESQEEDLTRLLDAVAQYRIRVGRQLGEEEERRLAGDLAELTDSAVVEDIRRRFADALDGTLQIRTVARSLSTFSRVEIDQLVPINLPEIIDLTLKMSFNEIKYRARLVKDFGEVPEVMANEGRLSQVFLNLLINAAQAIEEGKMEQNEIRVRTWAEGKWVCAEVCDSGAGIEPVNIARLFEPFFTTKEVGKGSGLGLSISKNIIEEYQGSIEVQSELGRGTRFIIRLPKCLDSVSPKAPGASVDLERDSASPARILVVDDERAIREIVRRMLATHEVVDTACGEEAQAILEKDQAFDLILCDLMMPNMTGMDLHEWLVAEHPELARDLVFITGGAFTPRAAEYVKKVENRQLEKPLNKLSFKNTIHELIASSRLRRSDQRRHIH